MQTISRSALILIGFLAIAILYISLPISAEAALPPRPTLMPMPAPAATPTPVAQPALTPAQETLLLYLSAGPAYDGAWTVVQWQGGDGVWHDVEGWRVHMRGGQVYWRVAEKDFGTGPFRWVVYDKEGGRLLAMSASFTLPTSDSQTVTVQVSPVAGE